MPFKRRVFVEILQDMIDHASSDLTNDGTRLAPHRPTA
jgi:hypothetical protein